MGDLVEKVALRAISRYSENLAVAEDAKAVEDIAPQIANEIGDEIRSASTDPFAYRAVVIILGAVLITVVTTYAIYSLMPIPTGKTAVPLPDALISLGAAAIGALAGLLAPAPGAN